MTEGNIWWLGSARKNWEQVMGTNPLLWFRELTATKNDNKLSEAADTYTLCDSATRQKSSRWPSLRDESAIYSRR